MVHKHFRGTTEAYWAGMFPEFTDKHSAEEIFKILQVGIKMTGLSETFKQYFENNVHISNFFSRVKAIYQGRKPVLRKRRNLKASNACST